MKNITNVRLVLLDILEIIFGVTYPEIVAAFFIDSCTGWNGSTAKCPGAGDAWSRMDSYLPTCRKTEISSITSTDKCRIMCISTGP